MSDFDGGGFDGGDFEGDFDGGDLLGPEAGEALTDMPDIEESDALLDAGEEALDFSAPDDLSESLLDAGEEGFTPEDVQDIALLDLPEEELDFSEPTLESTFDPALDVAPDLTPDDIQADIADIEEEMAQSIASLDEQYAPADALPDAELPTDADEAALQAEDIYGQFQQQWDEGQLDLLKAEVDLDARQVSAMDIHGARFHDDVSDDAFWSHHGNSKEMYLDLASKIPDVREQLESGRTLDEIKGDESLRACAEQYFDRDNMVKAYQYGDKYLFDGDGRHRIAAAQELGLEIPLNVRGAYAPKDAVSDSAEHLDFAEMVDNMSLDELNAEREKLIEMGVLDDPFKGG